jgi:hypothetical protein
MFRMPRHPLASLLALLVLALGGCKSLAGRPAKSVPNEVIVLGTEHGAHRESEAYSLERLEQLLRAVDPQVVLCEIPPQRFDAAWRGFIQTGEVSDTRVLEYPEFTDVFFPVALEGRFRLIPCSAWNQGMAERRNAQLEQWKTTRPDDTREVEEAQQHALRILEQEGLDLDPLAMHTARFDELVDEAMKPAERLFARDLGPGGWTEINKAHYELISDSLDQIEGEGKRVLVVFGSWHKGRLRQYLGDRPDIVLRRLPEVLPAGSPPGAPSSAEGEP